VHDAAVPPGLHCRQDGPAEQHRALDEEVQLGQVAGPGDLGHCGFGLRAGGVEDQHIDRAEVGGDRGDQPGDLVLVGDIGAEARRGPPSSQMARPIAATCSSPGRPLTATAKPSRASRRAITAPSPRELPVTKATRPCVTAIR
jgi:hypothetical protein